MASALSPFHLLEINLISAQDLAKVTRNMRTFAVAWVHPARKLTTRIDTNGAANPTWNDKFVFRVDDKFLRSEMSAVMIEIYCTHWFRDIHVGTVRVLLSNLIPPQIRAHNQQHLGMRFVALQVRRPSGRPQGILNVGVTVLDSTMRSMPLYTQLSTSALGYQQLMGTEDLHHHQNHGSSIRGSMNTQLRRSKSERSSLIGIDEEPSVAAGSRKGSEVNNGVETAGKKGGKIVYDKPLSIVDGGSELGVDLDVKKAKSVLSVSSSVAAPPAARRKKKAGSDIGIQPSMGEKASGGRKKTEFDNAALANKGGGNGNKSVGVSCRNYNKPKHNWLAMPPENSTKGRKSRDGNVKYPISKDFANGSVWSESEVGPSPSEVAAAIAEDSRFRKKMDYDVGGSSVVNVDSWSMNDSEGLGTKMERWRTDIPAVQRYDDDYSSYTSSAFTPKHTRRHTESGGKFSCFGNIGGYECSIVCGRNEMAQKRKMKRNPRAPSLDSWSTYL